MNKNSTGFLIFCRKVLHFCRRHRSVRLDLPLVTSPGFSQFPASFGLEHLPGRLIPVLSQDWGPVVSRSCFYPFDGTCGLHRWPSHAQTSLIHEVQLQLLFFPSIFRRESVAIHCFPTAPLWLPQHHTCAWARSSLFLPQMMWAGIDTLEVARLRVLAFGEGWGAGAVLLAKPQLGCKHGMHVQCRIVNCGFD